MPLDFLFWDRHLTPATRLPPLIHLIVSGASPVTTISSVGWQPAEGTGDRNLMLAALGVVYGDIGTSPLYAVRQSLLAFGDTSEAAIFGVLSLITWSLVLVVTVKYVIFIMRADNRGEGGLLALTALVLRTTNRDP